MLRVRTVILALALISVLFGIGRFQSVQLQKSRRLRSQPLVDLLQRPALRLVTSPQVEAADAAIVPQVQLLMRQGVPVSDRIKNGMSYPEITTVLGDEAQGDMMPDFAGWLNFRQGKRKLSLFFDNGRVAWKWRTGF